MQETLEGFFLVFLFTLGLCIGSFLNVLIDRLPFGKSVLIGRSVCDFCKKSLRWFELIPVFSFVVQRGKCRRCHNTLSLQYPLVEFATAIAFATIAYVGNDLPLSLLIARLALFSSLFSITIADLKYYIIPDSLVVVVSIAALFLVPESELLVHVMAAISGSTFFFLLWFITKGKGMGFGDVKLAFPLGLLHGPIQTVVAFYGAFLTGAVVGVILMVQGKKGLKSKIPFGPFMVLGSVLTFFWGERIITWWKGFI